jgi:hypothetical protein
MRFGGAAPHRCRFLFQPKGLSMNEDTFNLSVRKFLKMVGVNSQREIEHAVTKAIESGRIAGSESFPVTMTLHVGGIALDAAFDGEIKLE